MKTESCLPMISWFWNGSAFVRRKHIPVSDRGFRYGMSVFETIKVWDGKPQFLDRHLSRLRSACAERDFPWNESALEAVESLLSKKKHKGVARIYATAGDGGPASPVGESRLYVIFEEREEEKETSYEVIIHDDYYQPPFRGLKTANYWFNADALAYARSRKADEALLFNDLGELVSACMANVFLVRDDQVFTPSRASGCRGGVIRDWVIRRRNTIEKRLRREDILKADEIFITNSWLGVMPVSTVEGRPVGPSMLGRKLAGELEARQSE